MTYHSEPMARREALRQLALLPLEFCGLSALGAVFKRPAEDILTQCAAGITACWHLRKGKDLTFAFSIISSYIPTLKAIIDASSTRYQKAAADLLAQCLLLKATCTCYVNGDHAASLRYRQQAEAYGKLAENLALSILAIRLQASSYDYADNWEQAMRRAEKAKYLIETTKNVPIPLHVQSFVYAGLANYQAHSGQKHKQDALRSLGQAWTTLSTAGNEPVPIWIDGVDMEASLLLNGGLVYYHLDMQKEAIEAFARIGMLAAAAETQRTESFTDQVMAEVNRGDKSRDMDFCIDRWKQGIQGAIALRSEQGFNEAKVAYAAMRGAWPGEERIKDLRTMVVHW